MLMDTEIGNIAAIGSVAQPPHSKYERQTALHQELTLGLADQLHGLGGGGIAVRGVDHLETTDVEPEPLNHRIPDSRSASLRKIAPRRHANPGGCALLFRELQKLWDVQIVEFYGRHCGRSLPHATRTASSWTTCSARSTSPRATGSR
jgi:hypothetical protein